MVSLFSIPGQSPWKNPLPSFRMASRVFILTNLPALSFCRYFYSGPRNSDVVQQRTYTLRIRCSLPTLVCYRSSITAPEHLPSGGDVCCCSFQGAELGESLCPQASRQHYCDHKLPVRLSGHFPSGSIFITHKYF